VLGEEALDCERALTRLIGAEVVPVPARLGPTRRVVDVLVVVEHVQSAAGTARSRESLEVEPRDDVVLTTRRPGHALDGTWVGLVHRRSYRL
jgi:hypothetical protein